MLWISQCLDNDHAFIIAGSDAERKGSTRITARAKG